MSEQKELNFEKALSRLEEILENMNSGTISLDDSLKDYEEADRLIAICNKRLTDAERKIEKLIKKRSGEIETNSDQEPLTEELPL